MVAEDLKKERPEVQLADKVQFFIALREHDMKQIRALFFLDERVVRRACRLHRFLTQPFVVAEAVTVMPGESVPLVETLKGVREILAGRHNEVPRDAFFFKGTIEQVLEKAK